MSSGLNDVKHVTAEADDADNLGAARGLLAGVAAGALLWLPIGLAVAVLVAGGYLAGEGAAIERAAATLQQAVEHDERAAATQREAGLRAAQAWNDGYAAGRASVICLGGLRMDRATGQWLDGRAGRP
jgi:hypothetical protein